MRTRFSAGPRAVFSKSLRLFGADARDGCRPWLQVQLSELQLLAVAVFIAALAAHAYPSGSCNPVGTIDPEENAYTLCTTVGWVHVDRLVCADFPGWFTCTANPQQ
jgi:hypothetical protein